MKANKMVTLDTDVIFNLKKEFNASALINRLLKEHYRRTQDLKDKELPVCKHEWSQQCYSSPGGLFRECLICGDTKPTQSPIKA